jgi:hypothetical protein
MIIGMNGWVMKRYSEIFLKKERKKERKGIPLHHQNSRWAWHLNNLKQLANIKSNTEFK